MVNVAILLVLFAIWFELRLIRTRVSVWSEAWRKEREWPEE